MTSATGLPAVRIASVTIWPVSPEASSSTVTPVCSLNAARAASLIANESWVINVTVGSAVSSSAQPVAPTVRARPTAIALVARFMSSSAGITQIRFRRVGDAVWSTSQPGCPELPGFAFTVDRIRSGSA